MGVAVVVTLGAVAANCYAAFADFTRSGFARQTSTRVGVPAGFLPLLGTLKAAGALGLIAGLLRFHFLGVAAAAGLVLFFAGAIGVHLRAREHSFIRVTTCYFLLAVASLFAQAAT
jgi:hypothetical protein